MLVGSLAIAGIPPLAGFFSKDEILGQSFKNGFLWVWAIGVVVALMTAFYMFRLMGKTFYGKSHVDPAVEPKIHESTWTMTLPLIVLAIASALLGLVVGLPFGNSMISNWLKPVFEPYDAILGRSPESFQLMGIDGGLILVSVAVAVVGMVAAWRLFGFFGLSPRAALVETWTTRLQPLYVASKNKWYFDDINDLVFVRFGGLVAGALWWFDVHVIDGAVNGVASLTQGAGREIRHLQTGRVQNYALGIAAGLIIMAIGFLVVVSR
jgi:NADH-quinone oxidoreductase subunit L